MINQRDKNLPNIFYFLVVLLNLSNIIYCESFSETEKLIKIIKLNENNWTAVLNNEWMLEFYAPWCPACNALQSTWEEFSTISEDLGISVGQIDITLSPGLSGRFMVTALPTIFHIIKGEFRQYKGSRNKNALVEFVKDKKWKSLEPLPSWKSPASVQMSVLAYFFELSQFLRNVHTKLLEDYGLPTWGSYLLFAVVTILVGASIGLAVVFIIDYVFPPTVRVKKTSKTDKEKDSGEDTDDEIAAQDDLLDDQIVENADSSAQEENSAETSLTTKKRKVRKAD